MNLPRFVASMPSVMIGHHINACLRTLMRVQEAQFPRPLHKDQAAGAIDAMMVLVCRDLDQDLFIKHAELIHTHMVRRMIQDLAVVKSTSRELRGLGIEVFACLVCGQATRKKCAGCKAVWYCCKECQVHDRFNHKRWCSPPPAGGHKHDC